MKKTIIFTSALLAAFILTAFVSKKSHVDTYKVDTKLSSIEWTGKKPIGEGHSGTIMLSSGVINNDHGKFTGTFEIDMTTIQNTDQTGKSKADLEGHLKSDAFFGVAKFPKAKFEMFSAAAIKDVKVGGFTHTIKGNLTIKDKTNSITFDAFIKMEAGKITCEGTAIVDRSKFDVRYGSKTFFAEIGDKMINDEFILKFNIVAAK